MMRFIDKEIEFLDYIAAKEGAVRPRDLRHAFSLHPKTVSDVLTRLQNKGLVERDGGLIALSRSQPAESFKRLYYAHRASPFHLILAYGRADLLNKLDQRAKDVKELSRETGIPQKTIYYYLKNLLSLAIARRSKRGKRGLYSFNSTYWGELKDFVTSLHEYQERLLIPREALLIKGYRDGILFKSIKRLDATPTSFSAYWLYGIDLDLRDNYYILPKRKLSPAEVFLHSLDCADDLSHRLFCILFYLKNRSELEGIEHPLMKEIDAVLQGVTIKGYPALEDIKDRAELYDIEF
jgi:predicted transcriptional regulator